MAVLSRLVVKLVADAQQFEREVRRARTGIKGLIREGQDLASSTLAQTVGLAGLAIGLGKAFAAADRFEASQRQLAATAKITDQNLGFLQKTSADAQQAFGLSARAANDLTIEITKLTSKAGQIDKTSQAMAAFLDLGAARGLDAEATLQAVRQAILGIDEGTDKLFGKNPSVIYKEMEKAIGTAASKMSDAQKAQALLMAAMQDGGKVAGEFARFLETPAGKAFELRTEMEKTAASIGQSMSAARMAVLPLLSFLAEGLRKFVGGIQIMGAEIAVGLAHVENFAAKAGLALAKLADKVIPFDQSEGVRQAQRNADHAAQNLRFMQEAADEVKTEIVLASEAIAQFGGTAAPVFNAVTNDVKKTVGALERMRIVVVDAIEGLHGKAGSFQRAGLVPVVAVVGRNRELIASFEQAAAEAKRWAQQVESAISSGVSAIENELVDLIMQTQSVSEAFSDMVGSILRDLARLAVQKFITIPLFDAISSAVSPASVQMDSVSLASARAPGGGMSNVVLHESHHYTINAVDARSFDQLVRANPGAIQEVTARGARRSTALRAALAGA